MKLKLVLVIIFVCFLYVAGYAVDKSEEQRPGVYLYKQTNYRGVYYHFNWDDQHLPTTYWVGPKDGYHCFDNKVSSIKLVDVPFISVYSDPGYKGNCEVIRGDVPNLNKTSIGNNTISSVKLNTSCPTPGSMIELFQSENFKGRSIVVNGNVADLGASNFKNSTSSFKLNGLESVALFNHPYYEGKCQTFTRSMPSLKGTEIGNNSVASLKVNSKCDEYYTLTIKNRSAMLIDAFFPGGGANYWYGRDKGQRGDRNIPAGQSLVYYMTPDNNVDVRIRAFFAEPDIDPLEWKTVCTFNLHTTRDITIIAKGTMLTKMSCELE